jgi:hypothetical protein
MSPIAWPIGYPVLISARSSRKRAASSATKSTRIAITLGGSHRVHALVVADLDTI